MVFECCSEKYTRFCQWKSVELNVQVAQYALLAFSLNLPLYLFLIRMAIVHFQLTMNDFSVHRIIGRGGFGEVYGCRKADTGKM